MFSLEGNPVILIDFKNMGLDPLPVIIAMAVDTAGRLYVPFYRRGELWIFDTKLVRICLDLKWREQ